MCALSPDRAPEYRASDVPTLEEGQHLTAGKFICPTHSEHVVALAQLELPHTGGSEQHAAPLADLRALDPAARGALVQP